MPKLKKTREVHPTMTGYDFREDVPLTPRRAMRAKCLECSGTAYEVKKCTVVDCPLWPYRLGVGVCTNLEGARDKTPRSLGQINAAEQNLEKARAGIRH
jgi:hypothetical protein